jgi:hypothetical protein
MPNATWQVYVDFDRDGGSIDSGEEITQYVKSFRFFYGFRQPYTFVADEVEATIVLDNTDGRFSPENPSGVFYDKFGYRDISIWGTWNSSTTIQFEGIWESIQPQWGVNRERECVITAVGLRRYFQMLPARAKLQETVTTKTLLRQIVEDSEIPSDSISYWYLDAVGNSELGTTSIINRVPGLSVAVATASAKTVNYVGDVWGDNTTLYDAIKQICQLERGKFYINASLNMQFVTRYRLTSRTTVAQTFTNWHEAEYTYADRLANIIKVAYKPRTVSADNNEVIWQSEEEIDIGAGEQKTITARYAAPDSGAKVAGKNFRLPTAANGDLVSTTGTVGVVGFEEGARSATITLENGGTSPSTVTLIRLRGQKITTFSDVEVEVRDPESMARHGPLLATISYPLVSNEEEARSIAESELYLRSTPRGAFRYIGFYNQNSTYIDWAFSASTLIENRVRVIEGQTSHDQEYFVIGVEMEVSEAQKLHKTRFYLEPADPVNFWQLATSGLGELDTATYLSY